MTTPIVTEIPRALEPVGHDTFIDGPVTSAPAGRRSRYAAPRLVARASSGHAAGRSERSTVQTLAA
jgi:hypothetical protein